MDTLMADKALQHGGCKTDASAIPCNTCDVFDLAPVVSQVVIGRDMQINNK